MEQQLFRATVVCTPPAKLGGRFRCGRHFPAGSIVIEDLTQEEIDRLTADVLAESVNSLDRKSGKITQQMVNKSFFTVHSIEPNGTRTIADPKPAELPADRLPTGIEMFSLLRDMSRRMEDLERQNAELRNAPATQAPLELFTTLREISAELAALKKQTTATPAPAPQDHQETAPEPASKLADHKKPK